MGDLACLFRQLVPLWLRWVFVKTDWSAMLGATFILVTCVNCHNFWNNEYFSIERFLYHRNVFQNDINTSSKMVNLFWPKSSKFCIFRTIPFCLHLTSIWSKYLSNNVWRHFRLLISAFNGNIKCPTGKQILVVNFCL